jgi:hypothetical protein
MLTSIPLGRLYRPREVTAMKHDSRQGVRAVLKHSLASKSRKIFESRDLFLCPQSPMLVKLSIEVLDKPKGRPKGGCKSCNDIATAWMLRQIQKSFEQAGR